MIEATMSKQEKDQNEMSSVPNQILKLIGGKPEGFKKIMCSNVFGRCYRVNVYCGIKLEDGTKETIISHSFFVTCDEKGNVFETDPVISNKE